ncbi:hypothetical protein N9J52_04500 [Flavobacteriales bacterium]|nr:hypothetical protein [Flavobacteriales bacterium]
MKKLFTLWLLIISATVFAQDKITVKEAVVAIDGTSRNSLTVMLVGSNTDDVKKAWKKKLKELKGKVSDKTIIFGDDCKMKEMGDNSFDVYSLVEEATDEGVRLVVAFDLGGAYLSTSAHPEKYPMAEKFVYGFGVEAAKSVVSMEIEVSQKILGDFVKELAGLEKAKAGHESDIKDHEKKIEEAKEEIEQNVANQTKKKTEIEGIKATVSDLEVKLKNIK